MEEITANKFNLVTQTGKVVVEFFGVDCLNCQMMAPILNQLESIFPGIQFYQINVNEYPALSKQYKIHSLPTLLLFQYGQHLSSVIGVKSLSTLQKILDQNLNYT